MPSLYSPSSKLLSLVVVSMILPACGGGGSGSSTSSDTAAPYVVSSHPVNGATGVSRTGLISATFNEDMFAASVDNTSYMLTNGTAAVPATVSLNGSGNNTNTATLNTLSKLSHLSRYTATVTTDVTDLTGNALRENYTWSFTTEDGHWNTAMSIESDVGEASLPQISIDDQGNALAVWMQDDGTRTNIWANRYNSDNGSWGTATLIESEAGVASFPQIAIDGGGNALVVWVQSHDTQYSIWANRYSAASGSWGTAEIIESDSGDARVPQIAVDGSGNALAVWYQWDGGQFSIWGNRYNVLNNSWGSAELIELNDDDARAPQITVDYNGNAFAVWYQRDGAVNSIWANRYDVTDGGWGTAAKIETETGEALNPQVAVDNKGNAIAVWYQSDGTEDSIWANRYSVANNSWGTATLIELDAGNASAPQIAIDNEGNALVVWYQSNGTIDTSRFNRYSVTSDRWGTASAIGPDAVGAYGQQIAIDDNGNAIVAWYQSESGENRIMAYRYSALNENWISSSWIDMGTGDSDNPQIAVNRSGNALAVWMQHDGMVNNIMANRFE